MKAVLIITGGDIDRKFGKDFLTEHEYEEIIAVDGGLAFAYEADINPTYIVGDFDTIDNDILRKYYSSDNTDKNDTKIIRLNPVKDSTDTEEAVNLAIKLEAGIIHILGGIGNRLDHSLGNLFLLKKSLKNGVSATIFTQNSEIYMIDKKTIIENTHKYKYISFIQFDGNAKGVTLKGFKYKIENFDFDTEKTYRLGISNEFDGECGEVDIKSGELLVVMTNDS
ncbi:MAG: thiamine diphosphokinase [Lachnospiraceae bacterium]|nr:thiamine diphosphokinase [Lachnospiraceae bacterium]